MSLKKKIILGIVIVLICMQFYPQARNQSSLVTNDHIEKIYEVPKNVKTILVQSCYDCHSDNTRYPWYSYIQPGGRYMAQHIQKGKEELNFSTFGKYSVRKQRNKFRAMAEQVREGAMPLSSYTLMHRNAILSPVDKQLLVKWFNTMENDIKQKF